MSTIAVAAVLGGGGAYAASKITAKDIAPNAVRAKHIRAGQVGARHLRSGAVTAGKLAGLAVATGKLADGAVTTAKLGAGAVTNAELAAGAVDSDRVEDGSLRAADFAPGEITDASIENFDYLGLAVPGDEVLAREVTLERSGRLLVIASLTAVVNCAGPGPCTRAYGIFTRGAGEPQPGEQAEGSTAVVPSSGIVTRPVTLLGLSAELPAGTHTVAAAASTTGRCSPAPRSRGGSWRRSSSSSSRLRPPPSPFPAGC